MCGQTLACGPIPPLLPPVQRWAVPGNEAGAEEHCVLSKVRRHLACLAGGFSRNTGTPKSHKTWPRKPREHHCDWKQ